MWPAEKSRFSDAVLSGAVRSLQSGFLKNYREKWASVAYFSGKGVGISPQLRLAGGASTIRTFVTFLYKIAFLGKSSQFPNVCVFDRQSFAQSGLQRRTSVRLLEKEPDKSIVVREGEAFSAPASSGKCRNIRAISLYSLATTRHFSAQETVW